MAPCHVCDSPRLEPVHAATRPLGLVSSDVQALEARVTWAVCPRCGTIQKVIDRDWHRLTEGIYERYRINHQAAGQEPRLFNTPFGSGPRTEILLKYLLRLIDLPAAGKLLDIGCSNGNLLKSFHRIRPEWELYGYEISDMWKEEVLALPGVRGFHTGTGVSYPFRYDLITVCHVLEHVPNPAAFLRPLLANLTPAGRIVVIVPNIRQNPIDLLIADHCSHFDAQSLDRVLRVAGLPATDLTARAIPKELIAIAGPAEGETKKSWSDEPAVPADKLCRDYFRLFDGVREAARAARAEAVSFGIMGSSIAAAWLAREIGDVAFFADEDESRRGHSLMDRPIVSLAEVPAGATVFIPMSRNVAARIIARAGRLPIEFRYLDWNRLDPVSGVVRPPRRTEARRRA
ncbi:MAG: class I SAM-dependent methyltransferase [Hyphomicrobiales bacterium]|nr:class I SAM-dependent methyltransferase [Hyphomicrobiales bacterium]MBV9428673.1 class I SAM-dependent methyltransferase [Bradyrhizobiaceae bacterium]